MANSTRPKRVFLSCVSREYGADRPKIQKELADQGIELTVQEDFERTASPVGTLGKIYRYIKQCDLVVQLIGPTPPKKVRIEVAKEVLDLDPNFATWLAQRAIIPALKAGVLGYTDFEAYLALYLRKPFMPIRFRSGAQPEHEKTLLELGRHVEININKIDELAPHIRNALETINVIDQPTQVSVAAWRSFLLEMWSILLIVAALAACFTLQLSAGGAQLDVDSLVHHAAKFVAAFLAYFVLHLAAMGEFLVFSFRLRASLRNGTAMILIFAVIGWLLSGIYYWIALIGGAVLLAVVVRRDANDLELEHEHGTSDLTPGTITNSDGFFWYERHVIEQAKRVPNSKSRV